MLSDKILGIGGVVSNLPGKSWIKFGGACRQLRLRPSSCVVTNNDVVGKVVVQIPGTTFTFYGTFYPAPPEVATEG